MQDVCDSVNDCGDWSDELGCGKCLTKMFNNYYLYMLTDDKINVN